jgi:hypothetical protein
MNIEKPSGPIFYKKEEYMCEVVFVVNYLKWDGCFSHGLYEYLFSYGLILCTLCYSTILIILSHTFKS